MQLYAASCENIKVIVRPSLFIVVCHSFGLNVRLRHSCIQRCEPPGCFGRFFKSEACGKTGQEGYDVIAIDEAQDFTPCQASAFLWHGDACTYVVGDARQRIYRWRGASEDCIKRVADTGVRDSGSRTSSCFVLFNVTVTKCFKNTASIYIPWLSLHTTMVFRSCTSLVCDFAQANLRLY